MPSIRYPSFNAYFVPIWKDMTEQQFLEYTERLPLRKHFYRRMGRTGFSQDEIDVALERLNQTLTRMEAALAGMVAASIRCRRKVPNANVIIVCTASVMRPRPVYGAPIQ